jgi:hypothetical protein
MVDSLLPPSAPSIRVRRVLLALSLLLGGLTVVLIAERLGYAGLYRPGGLADPDVARRLAVQLVLSLPSFVYLASLWELRRAVRAVASETPFAAAVGRGLRRVGYCLIGGAALTLGGLPTASRLLGQPYPRLIDFDVTTLVVGGIGLGFILVARLVEQARAAQAELNEMF